MTVGGQGAKLFYLSGVIHGEYQKTEVRKSISAQSTVISNAFNVYSIGMCHNQMISVKCIYSKYTVPTNLHSNHRVSLLTTNNLSIICTGTANFCLGSQPGTIHIRDEISPACLAHNPPLRPR
jgi:hypothetical protein